MVYLRLGQWVPFQINLEPLPVVFYFLAPPFHPFSGNPYYQKIEPCHASIVTAHSIILIMPPELHAQDFPPLLYLYRVSDLLQPFLYVPDLGAELLTACRPAYFIFPFSGFVVVVGKSQKIERCKW